MHILYPCNEYPPSKAGGIGTAVATLARGMANAGHKVTSIGMYPATPSVQEEQGVTVHRLALSGANKFINWWINRRRLHQAILEIHRRDPIDVIEWPDFQGWYWKPVPGATEIVKVHGTTMSHRIHGLSKRQRMTEFLELRTLRTIRNWVGVSRWFNKEWKQVAGVTPRHETIVYNPVNTSLFHPSDQPRERNLVLYAGGLRRRKGVHVLARAAQTFLQKVPGARLMLISFPSDMTEQDVRREAGPVADKLEFVPFMTQKELVPYIAKATVYAMPSLYESCGNTWLEAGACETPVIGSTLSCGPEIVLDGQTGLLSDPENPADIAEKIIRLLTEPALAAEMGKRARQRVVNEFSAQVAVRESDRFYRLCMNDR